MVLRALCRGVSGCRTFNGHVITSKARFVGAHRRFVVTGDYESRYAEKLRMRADE
jgi:hypothetical protein